jgi:hypothetical protein
VLRTWYHVYDTDLYTTKDIAMTFNWEEVKDDIERLYMKEGKSLKEVREILKHTRNFSAS